MLRRARAFVVRGVALIAFALVAPACVSGISCPSGQQAICRSQGDCMCGPPCSSQNDCSGLNACVRFASAATDPGVCVSAIWALNNPPCVPLCRTNQECVMWTDRPSACANTCALPSDCSSGCCLALTDGTHVCAPAATYCQNTCNPPCATDEICVSLGTPTCGAHCTVDTDCAQGCCLMLQGGGGVCSPHGVFCPTSPTMPTGPCADFSTTCAVPAVTTATGANARCGTYGSYDAEVRNTCSTAIRCLGCWWSPTTHAYSICSTLGPLPIDAAAAVGTTQCADEAITMPLRIRCVDAAYATNGVDCLGAGPL